MYWYENGKLKQQCPNCYVELFNEMDACDCCGYNLKRGEKYEV